MKVFPQSVPSSIFLTSADGRFTTEAQVLIERARLLLENGRNHEYFDDLGKAIAILIMSRGRLGWPTPLLLTMSGQINGAVDRRIYGMFFRLLMRLVAAGLEVVARGRGIDDGAPEWNDYVLAYWEMTGDPDAVEELYLRANTPQSDKAMQHTKGAAMWLVASVRSTCAEFDRAYREVEERESSAARIEKALERVAVK